ncbi:MAG: queuosine precursor transporter [Lachnospiraceae bacterium]|nr:queuosine precursor transporter [Lachnospiraceae bacterium]
MSNNILFLVSVFVYLAAVLLLYKFYGKNGLFIFAVFSTVLANIQVCKCVDVFGLSTTAGNTLYAATFLVTDILSEKYGKKDAARAVGYGVTVTILWIIGTQLTLLFAPNANDYISDSLVVVFGLVPRIAIASLIGYTVSQSFDVFLYHKIWSKTGSNKSGLWIRNNFSTLTSQLLDTVIFTTLAFWGTYPVPVFFSILITTYFFKAVVALCDTPFIYLARMIHPVDEEPKKDKGEKIQRRMVPVAE